MSKLANTTFICAAICMLSQAAIAHADEGTIVGRVARGGDDSAVRVCFTRAIEVNPGQEFAVVRHTLRNSSPKATPALESTQVGVLKIAAVSAGHCVHAIVVTGSARWLDWVSTRVGS